MTLNAQTITKPYLKTASKRDAGYFVTLTFVDDTTGKWYTIEIPDQQWTTRAEADAWLAAQDIIEHTPTSDEVALPEGVVLPPVPAVESHPFITEICNPIPAQDIDVQGDIVWPDDFNYRQSYVIVYQYVNRLIDEINLLRTAHGQAPRPNITLDQFKQDMKDAL